MRLVKILESDDSVVVRAKALASEWAADHGIGLTNVVVVGSWGKRKYPKDVDLAATADSSPLGLEYPWQMVAGYPVDLFITFNGRWFAPVGGAASGATYEEVNPKFAARYGRLTRKMESTSGVRSVRFADLPEDLMQLTMDFASYDEDADVSSLYSGDVAFNITDVPVSAFPVKPVGSDSGDNRDAGYAMQVPIDDDHPVVLIGDQWVDGRHRVYRARADGLRTVPAINLADLGVTMAVGSMGRVFSQG